MIESISSSYFDPCAWHELLYDRDINLDFSIKNRTFIPSYRVDTEKPLLRIGYDLFASCNNEMSWPLIEISWICVVKLFKSEITQTQICLLHFQNPESDRQPINILWTWFQWLHDGLRSFFKSNTAIIFHFFKSYFLKLCRMQNFHFSFFTSIARILFRISYGYEINRCFISRLLEIQMYIYIRVFILLRLSTYIKC